MMNEGKNEEVAETWSQKPVCLGPCCDAEMRQPTAGLWTSIFDINRIDGSIQTHSDEAVLSCSKILFQKSKQRLARCKHSSQTPG